MNRITLSILLMLLGCNSVFAEEDTDIGAIEDNDAIWAFTLIDGSTLVGRIVSKSDNRLDIVLLNGAFRSIFTKDVAHQGLQSEVQVVRGEIWETNPNRTRHFWSPSSIPLKKGEGYLSQKELFFTSYAIGLTDNVAVLVSSLVPALFNGPEGLNLINGWKYGRKVSSNVYLSTGGEALLVLEHGAFAIAYAGITLGRPDAQVSLNVGVPFSRINNDELDDKFTEWKAINSLISLSGMLRISGSHGLVMENILFPGASFAEGTWGSTPSIHGFAWRRMGNSASWDLGFIGLGGEEFVFPWFDYTWHFE